mgnify:FL=1
MLVETPAIKFGVAVRKVEARDAMLVMSGVAGAMPCTIEISGKELLSLAGRMMRPAVLSLMLKALFSKAD